MGSFFKNLRGNAQGPYSPSAGPSPPKKDPHAPPMTPLEKMLLDSGPVRSDGSDKFFGMENYGNTWYTPGATPPEYLVDFANPSSYCNSILQCLYYSVPFREAVINYPKRTPIETLESALARNLKYQSPEAFAEAEAAAAKAKAAAAGQSSSRSAGVPPAQPPKVEDKDSPEYKKKVAIQTLPLLETKDNSASYGMPESLFTSLKDIFESLVASQSKMGVIRPHHFLEVLRRENEMFRSAMHQDAHEFLNLLLNEVVTNVEAESSKQATADTADTADSEQTLTVTDSSAQSVGLTKMNGSTGSKTPNTSRWVHELFEGTLTSETQCLTCEKVSQRDEVFLDLSVDLEQHSSVTSCLRKFSAEEMLCERNKFHCDNCGGLQEAEKRMKIKRLPKILALHLKRFKYTEDLQRLQKLFHRVVYPYHLRLFNTTDDAEDPDRLYELYAVVVHIGGGPYHGHYVAIIKTEDRGWLLFDDEMVEPVDKNYVRNFFGDRPGLACAYVLFYQETTLAAVQREQEQEGLHPTNGTADVKESNGVPLSSPLNHIHTYQGPPDDDAHRFSPLKSVPTAPQMSTHPEHAFSTSPPAPPPIPSDPPMSLSPKKSDVQSRKERAREEKERKAAEKEKERAEKQRRKEQEAKRKEETKREEADLKAAREASKVTKAEEDRRMENGDSSHNKTLAGSLNRFRRSSKSLSHRFASKDGKRASSSEFSRSDLTTENGSPPDHHKLHEHVIEEDVPTSSSSHGVPVTLPSSPPDPPSRTRTDKDKGNHKWKGFGLRKKSMSLMG